jgi:hypothetical protein
MEEVATKRSPRGLRNLFCILVLMCELKSSEQMLLDFAVAMTVDWVEKGMAPADALEKLRRYVARRLDYAGVNSNHELLVDVDLTVQETPLYVTPDEAHATAGAAPLPTRAQLNGKEHLL